MKKIISLLALMGSIELAHAGDEIGFEFRNYTDFNMEVRFNSDASACVYQENLPNSVTIGPKQPPKIHGGTPGVAGPFNGQTERLIFSTCPERPSTFAFDFIINGQKQTCGFTQGAFDTHGTTPHFSNYYHSSCPTILGGNPVYVSGNGTDFVGIDIGWTN